MNLEKYVFNIAEWDIHRKKVFMIVKLITTFCYTEQIDDIMIHDSIFFQQ